jgi:hypothetical protein
VLKVVAPAVPAAPEMFLKEISNVSLIVTEGNEFEQKLVVVNKGKDLWPNSVELRCIAGPLKGLKVSKPE